MNRRYLWKKAILLWVFFFMVLIGVAESAYAAKLTPLAASDAFIFTTTLGHSNEVLLNWQIAPGYYLYRDRLNIEIEPAEEAFPVLLPQGELKYIPDANGYHRAEVYANNLSIPVKLKPSIGLLRLTVSYQGCASDGFCYPPMSKVVSFNAATQVLSEEKPASAPLTSLLTNQQEVQSLFQNKSLAWMWLLFLGLGLLLAFTPCVLPMIPILTGIIVGQNAKTNTKRAFLLSLTYVLGMSFTYAGAGVAAALLGSSLQVWLQQPWIIAGVAGIFVLLAISLFGFFDIRLPNRLHQCVATVNNKLQSGTFVGVALMGVLSTLIISPCVTAPLVGVLVYIGETGSILVGASALFALGLGMGIPLLVIGTSAGSWLPKSGPWMEVIKKLFGFLMLGMAFWLLSRVLSQTMFFTALGIFLICIALFIARHLSIFIPHRPTSHGVAYAVALIGIGLISLSLFFPNKLSIWMNTFYLDSQKSSQFIIVKNIQSLDKALMQAQAANQPVILDFYADWCDSCVIMDKKVFNLPSVQHKLSHYVLLRADLSANSLEDRELLKYFQVIAPPTILFFNPRGQEMKDRRIVGMVDAKEFIAHLSNI